MGHPILKGCVKQVRSYLTDLGLKVTQAQAYEIVARARGFQDANVLSAQYVPESISVSGKPSLSPNTPEPSKPLPHGVPSIAAFDIPSTYMSERDLREMERMDLGVCGLNKNYVDRRWETSRLTRRCLEMEAIIPLPNNQPVSLKRISEIVLEHSDAVTNCTVNLVNYPYGKYFNAYLVKFKPYSYQLPRLDDTSVRVSLAHTREGLAEALASKAYARGVLVGFGFTDIDWKLGNASTRDLDYSEVRTDAQHLQIRSDGVHNRMWLSKTDVENLCHLVGCYYEVTTGLYEGMRIAFYA